MHPHTVSLLRELDRLIQERKKLSEGIEQLIAVLRAHGEAKQCTLIINP